MGNKDNLPNDDKAQNEPLPPADTGATKPDANISRRCSKKQNHKFERVFLVLTFLAASGAAFFTGQQWMTNERHLEVSRDSEKRQLRAYLSVEAGDITGTISTDRSIATVITIKPFGSTPAYNVRLAVELMTERHPLPDNVHLAYPTGDGATRAAWTIVAGAPVQKEVHTQINEDTLKSIKEGNIVFYLLGKVTYADIFGDEWPYEFCFIFFRDGLARVDEGCKPYNRPR